MRIHRKPIRIAENQGHLPFRTKNTGLLSYVPTPERKIFGILSGIFLLLALAYMYFLTSSVGYVSLREEMAGTSRTLSGQTAQVEAAYLARSIDMTEAYARTQGLVHTNTDTFVEREVHLTVVQ